VSRRDSSSIILRIADEHIAVRAQLIALSSMIHE
jgi:hypothetical protein